MLVGYEVNGLVKCAHLDIWLWNVIKDWGKNITLEKIRQLNNNKLIGRLRRKYSWLQYFMVHYFRWHRLYSGSLNMLVYYWSMHLREWLTMWLSLTFRSQDSNTMIIVQNRKICSKNLRLWYLKIKSVYKNGKYSFSIRTEHLNELPDFLSRLLSPETLSPNFRIKLAWSADWVLLPVQLYKSSVLGCLFYSLMFKKAATIISKLI